LQDERQHKQGIEIYGTEGTLSVPSPCYWDGVIYYCKKDSEEWTELPGLYSHGGMCRGLGAAEIAGAVLSGREARIKAEMAYHCLEVLIGLEGSSSTGLVIPIDSEVATAAPLRIGVVGGDVDAK
jgi:predicted dehydrogenase